MRVLHVHSGNLYGGVETFLATLARSRHLAPSMEMDVALCFDGPIGAELRAEQIETPMLGAVRLRRPDSVWRARQALTAVLHRARYDVVVCHQAWPLAIFGSVVKAAGLPLVEWVHMAQTGQHWLERLAARVQPDGIICNSKFTASVLPPSACRVEVIYYPVESTGDKWGPGSYFQCVTQENRIPDPIYSDARARIRQELGAAPGQVVIVQVSRMEKWKGQTVCIEALGELRRHPNWVCWQVGGAQRPMEARYLASLRADAGRLGIADRVRFAGHRSDIPAVLAGADIFCQPNLEPEPFGISFIEALFAGLPVVTSGIGGALEILDENCGVLADPGDSGEIASVLRGLIGDRAERERLGHHGPARALSLCDPRMQMPRIADALERLACSRPVVQ